MALVTLEGEVPAAWVDFNDHMSAAWFAFAFACANDLAVERLGFGAGYRAAEDSALYVVEAKYRYRAEMHRGDRYTISSWLAGADDKRVSLAHRMTRADGSLAAEAEILFLHVDRRGPRAAPFSSEARARLAGEAALAPS